MDALSAALDAEKAGRQGKKAVQPRERRGEIQVREKARSQSEGAQGRLDPDKLCCVGECPRWSRGSSSLKAQEPPRTAVPARSQAKGAPVLSPPTRRSETSPSRLSRKAKPSAARATASVQKHDARRLHFDLRLEMDGVSRAGPSREARAWFRARSASRSTPRTIRSSTSTSKASSRRASTAAEP